MGKAHILPSNTSQTTYSHTLELIYSDLWGPSPNTFTLGFKYYMSFVDAFSKFTWIYFLKTKVEDLTTFKQFKTMVEIQHGVPIKAIQFDWVGEFKPFTKFLTDSRITHRVICPHTHHKDIVFERKHSLIVDMGLTFLSQTTLPRAYWDYAFSTTVYIINKLPSSSIDLKVLYNVLFNIKPDYKILIVFGCAWFPLLRSYNPKKNGFRVTRVYFLRLF